MNPWHLMAFATTDAGASTNVDLPSVADPVFQRRNNHLILSEPWNVIAALPIGATLTRLRFSGPTMIQEGIPHFWPLEVSATIPDLPQIHDFRDNPIELPLNEEVTLEYSSTAVGGDQKTLLAWLAPSIWRQDYQRGSNIFNIRATVVNAAGAENTWGADTAMTFERDLRNGVYMVVGAWAVAANALAFRLIFPSMPSYRGRKYRPGGLVQNATADSPNPMQRFGFGEWGRFHTFELPQIQFLSDAAGGTYEVRLALIKLGESQELLYQ